MTRTLSYTSTLVIETCCVCAMTLGMERSFHDARRDDHELWSCPAGHKQFFSGRSEVERLRDELELAERQVGRATSRADQARAEAAHNAAQARGYKGALAKTKKRIGKGVCPNCNRHFTNVERHMASQHPGGSA